MTTIALTLIILALLARDYVKDRQHERQIADLSLLVKSETVPEFVAAKAQLKPREEPEDEDDGLIPIEEATPEELQEALTKPERTIP